jgi:hypothetical protein
MGSITISKPNKQERDNLTDVQKRNAGITAKYGTPEQQSELLNSESIKDLLKISYEGEEIYKILAKSKSIDVKFKLLDVITSKSPDLLEMAAPILIKEANLAFRHADTQTSKDMIRKVWESIKMVDNPSDPKILNSGEKEKLAYSLFTSAEGFNIVSDFLGWLNDTSALKAYKEYTKVNKEKYYKNFLDTFHTREKNVVRSRSYLVNNIAKYGGDEFRLELLNAIDRLKAYELLYLEDKTESKTRYNFNPVASKSNHKESLYSIIAASSDEEAISKFLDVVGKMENGGELLLAKPQNDYYYSKYHFDGLVSLIAAKMDFEYKFNAEINGEISNKILALAEKYPLILGSRFRYGSEEHYTTVAEIIAEKGGKEIQEKLLKFIEIPGLAEPITKAINKYSTEELKKEVQKFLLGPFKLRV